MVFRGIDGNPVQPGIEGAIATEIAQGAISLDKSLLRDVLNLGMVAHIAAYDGKDLVLILKHEQIERAFVTFLYARYQLLVCVLRRLRCHSKTPKHSDRDIEAHRHASLLDRKSTRLNSSHVAIS